MNERVQDQEKLTQQVLVVLEKWGSESRFIWFRELHRITDIDKGILRNIISELKKSKEIKDLHAPNTRIFFCLKKYYAKCNDAESRDKGKIITLRDGSKTKFIQGATKSSMRTKKLLEKHRNKRGTRSFRKAKNRRPHKS